MSSVKKLVLLLLAISTVYTFSSCARRSTTDGGTENIENDIPQVQETDDGTLRKVGLIVSGGEKEIYSNMHIAALSEAIQDDKYIILRTEVPYGECYSTVVELVGLGCEFIFTAEEGFEDYFVQAATEYADVHFCVAAGEQAEQISLNNLHSYSVNEAEVWYLNGIVAGMKLMDMINNGELSDRDLRIGFVGTVPNQENRSALTAYYLGVKSVCSDVSLLVKYSGDEYDSGMETSATAALIANRCSIIAQYSCANGAAEICRANGVFFVGNLVSPEGEFWLCSAVADWYGSYNYAIDRIVSDAELPLQWTGTAFNAVQVNKDAFTSGELFKVLEERLMESKSEFDEGRLQIFDVSKWTVNGEQVSSTACEELWADYYGMEFIIDGCFREYEYSSRPKFAFVIDGITELS